ncbi:WD40 repeat domain-containing protein [Paenibacillus apiarius]|uniref:Uncharacterized protein n=1 Tax=Paenibacillus apiarius TaxID=46240 RepID=A0ABT4DTZ3_9BACL|nr:hypothetical protein [Paenibacillus apiarius]MCY9516319.1 hypothetical protein [Paenibacillus apiarius]MCY9519583.1 hypothetical protein [Paenibacillus apiarius]MCY9554655.1 hypothetical protein [Paenibacillus apiarius]MCY9561518.1 hypothetical protein [Paenibacillus apiarius]MCY9684251.1 hypothetical protein [Paenibacillus apiarius]
MTWLNELVAMRWRQEGARYAKDVNEFVGKGLTEGWDAVDEVELQGDGRSELAEQVLEMVAAANEAGDIERLRRALPAATLPFMGAYKDRLKAVKSIFFIDEDTYVFRSGATWESGCVHAVSAGKLRTFEHITLVGRSPNGETYALVAEEGIRTMRGLHNDLTGELLHSFSWGNIYDSIKSLRLPIKTLADLEEPPHEHLTEIIPFADGKKLILVSNLGIYLVAAGSAKLLHPSAEEIEDWGADDVEDIWIDMVHAALSHDEKHIALGSQGSSHLLYDAEGNFKAEIYPESSYPHYCLFTRDDERVLFNSCHFYNGITLSASIQEACVASPLEVREDDIVEDGSRVYAAAVRGDEIILGDANGYLRTVKLDGSLSWQYFLGGTISGITVSPSGNRLAVGTYGGMLHLLDLDMDERDPYAIGTAAHWERERWIVWKGLEQPLRW